MVSLVGSTSLVPTLGIPYDTYLKAIAGIDWFMTQEQPPSSVALATNSALALGRRLNGLLYADYVAGAGWANGGSEVAVGTAVAVGVALTQTIVGLEAGKTYQVIFTLSNYVGGSIRPDIMGATGTARFANDTYTEQFTATAGTATLVFTSTGGGAFTGDIDLKIVLCQQTGILASSAYAPGTNPMDGTYTSVTLGGVADGNLGYAPLWDGTDDNLAVISAEKNSKTDPTSYHELIWVQKDTWDTTERDILSHTVDANNWIRIVDTTTAGTISWQHRAGGTTEEVTLATGSPTGWFLVGISVESGVMKAWYNEAQTGANQSVAGTFVGNFVTMNYGSRAASHFHKGSLTRAGSATSELSVATVSGIYYGAQI